jgi:hypothetical protein
VKLTNMDVRFKINEVWPHLSLADPRILSVDKIYWTPKRKSVESLLYDSFIENYGYLKEIFDCDDFALILHAFVVQERYRWVDSDKKPEGGEWLPWVFGEIGINNHMLNFCLTEDDGFIIIEPQSDEIREADTKRDIPKFIKF